MIPSDVIEAAAAKWKPPPHPASATVDQLTFAKYVRQTARNFHHGYFSDTVCKALDQFILDVFAGKRPILILQAPPQHYKSTLASRFLPAYLMGTFPDIRIGCASYADSLAMAMAQDVRRILASDEHQALFPAPAGKQRYGVDRAGEFSSPGGAGGYLGVGIGAGLSGRSISIGIIDDPIKDAQEALSATTKEGVWNWYQAVFCTRMAAKSGHIVMATSWAQDDLAGLVMAHRRDDASMTVLRFPAINSPDEAGYDPDHPLGALNPGLHPLEQLVEIKTNMSAYWWAAQYQQRPQALGGNVFQSTGIRHYLPKDLPDRYDKIIASWDMTFKDSKGSDFVVGQVWGRSGAMVYLLDQVRGRMAFTETVASVLAMKAKWPQIREFLVEDKANGPAVIDALKKIIPGLIPVEPDGSKLARAHAVTSFWESGNVFLPHASLFPWVTLLLDEIAAFPVAAHDDQVDAMTQALRKLYPLYRRMNINPDAIKLAMGFRI